jgi:2-polyprenyl-3-methyl-5-hydroxy-6-metoxy-1,4-benzoquinol methylase
MECYTLLENVLNPMDLTQYHPTPQQVEAAARLLRYQPFVVDDHRHTGVAYVWLHRNDPTRVSFEDFFFDRVNVTDYVWNKAYEANRRLAAMYDGYVKRIVDICPPGGSYLDVGCNTGYFPVKASMLGLRTAVGIDLGDYSQAVQLLNEITGASAKFSNGSYDPLTHTIRIGESVGVEKFDVVSMSAILCHLPDPLHFLAAVSRLASKAIFMWSSFLETEELLIHYNPPNKYSNAEFPNGFEEGTDISLGLLMLSMSKLGFAHHEELDIEPDWMPKEWLRGGRLHAFLFWR